MKSTVLIALLLLAPACKRAKDGASCGDVTAHFTALANGDLAAAPLDDTTRDRVRGQLPAIRDALDTNCKDGKWTRAVRDCLSQAPDHVAFESCERQLTDAQKAALDRSTRGEEPW